MLKSTQMAADGVDSSRVILQEKVSMKPIEVRDLKVGYCYDSSISAGRAAVSITDTEWKRLTRAGCAAQYWAQENGRWTKKAEG